MNKARIGQTPSGQLPTQFGDQRVWTRMNADDSEENQSLRSQNVTLKRGQHSKHLSFAFTEQGVAN